jgi:hypothetical protein
MPEISAFAALLLKAAQAIGAQYEPAPQELVGDQFNFEQGQDSIPLEVGSRRLKDLPPIISCVRLDAVPVLIGELKGPPVRAIIEAQMRLYRNQATVARSWLAAEAPNLQLFLTGPQGALGSPQWRQIAAEIEADDRTCRKLVWLFNKDPGQAEAHAFLMRTFVARPWPMAPQKVSLDTVASYSLPKGWEEAAEDSRLDFDGLVARLVQLEGEA